MENPATTGAFCRDLPTARFDFRKERKKKKKKKKKKTNLKIFKKILGV